VPRVERLKSSTKRTVAGAEALVSAPLPLHAFFGKTQSPVEQAYHYILRSILSGELTPGMRVPAEAVADALGISRMPVRDALRRLEGDGAVMIFTNRGASVAEFSRDEVIQLIEMRAALEGLAARVALEHIRKAELDELEQLKQRMERVSDDLARWMSAHDDFHNYLTALSRRRLLMQQTERMRIMLRPYYRIYYASTRELEMFGLEHRKIIDALRKGDPDRVENIVRLHAMKNVQKVADLA
jgi:DNA-binding GntR family transcriptional regulator